jgi:hypothetical protein
MKCTLTFLLAATLTAQEIPLNKSLPPVAPPPAAALTSSSKSVVVIDPKMRAADYAQAFDLLRREKPMNKITIRTSSTVYSNVTELSVTKGGTLLLLKSISNQGTKTNIVPVEDIMEISYSLS